MINFSTITKQIQDWLISDENLDGFTVERSEIVNEDANRAVNGWIGIYRRRASYDPRNLGTAPNNYESDIEFIVIVQGTSMKSGADAEDCLEKAVKNVLDRVVQLPKTHIDHFSDIEVEYTYIDTDRKSMHFQGALITFTAEVDGEVK
jgi:hypothetical protein